MSYVICPAKITGPVTGYDWMPPNVPCGVKCKVVTEAAIMEFRCARGHRFYATLAQVKLDE